MARIDGIGRLKRSPVSPKPVAKASKRSQMAGNRASWPAIILVALATMGATYLYYRSQTENTPADSQQTTTTPAYPANSSTSPPNATNTTTTVNVYDSGAGPEALAAAIAAIEAAGYSTNNLSASQLQYDKTYIWYRTDLEADAKKIAASLKNRQVVISPTKITGSFDILIYLGKK